MIRPSLRSILVVGALCAPVLAHPSQSASPSGRILAFLAAPPAQQAADPTVPFEIEPFTAVAGDVLAYVVRVPTGAGGARGIEVHYTDGRHTPAPECAEPGTWRTIRVPLLAGAEVGGLELVARGANGAQVAFQVDDVRVEHEDGTTTDVFHEDLPGGTRRLGGGETSAGAVLVALTDDFVRDGVRTRADVGDPWAAIDLSALCALDRAADPLDVTVLPRGLTWTGPCVPLRFARAADRASFAARGQRLGFEPLDGGRFYEVWLALANTTQADIDTQIEVQGVDRGRTPISLRVPARGPDGYAPREGDGYPAREFALIEVDVASAWSLQSLQLPDDPRLRVLAVTIAWRRDGAADPRFRARCLARAAATGADLSEEDRAGLVRYVQNRQAAAVFGGVADDDARERALFQALLAGDAGEFRTQLEELVAAQRELGDGRKAARIDLLASIPRARDDALAARDLAAALAEGVLPADMPVLAGDGAAITVLARRDPAALERLVQRVHDKTWVTFGASIGSRAAARFGADGLAHELVQDKLSEIEQLGATSGVDRLDGDLGRLQNLPQMLAAAGTRVVVLGDVGEKLAAPFALWESAGSQVTMLTTPVVREGPLRLDPARWQLWMATAAAGATIRPPIPVLCDVSAPVARETQSYAAKLAGADLAPTLAWSSLEEVVAAARPRTRPANTPAMRPLARDGMRAELGARAAVRSAERELGRLGVAESLAVLDGGADAGARLASLWGALIDAANSDAQVAVRGAVRVGAQAANDATTRLSRLRPVVPHAGPGVPLAVLDVVPWPRTTLLEFPGAELRIADSAGDLPMQRTASGGVLVEYASLGLQPTAVRVRRDALAEPKAAKRVRLEGWTVRTDDLEVVVDPKTGLVARLRVPAKDVDLLTEAGAGLSWIALGSAPEAVDHLDSIEYVERGPLRAIVRTVHSSARARVETEIRVTPGSYGLEIRSRATLVDRGGDLVASFPLRNAAANALVSIPLGSTAIVPSASDLHALDGWAAATDGRATFALLGENGAAYRWNERTFEVLLAEAGAAETRAGSFRVLGNVGAWKAAGLDAALLEAVQPPLRVAFDSNAAPGDTREPLVRIARIERDGRRSIGLDGGLLPLSVEPGPDGTIDIRFVEVRGEAARVQIDIAREPFGARRVDLLGNTTSNCTVTGRSLDVGVEAGHLETVRVRLGP